MMANTQKLIIFPKDYRSTFRVCNSPFFRSVRFCLGFRSMSGFLLFLTTLINNGTELQQSCWALSSFPSKVEGNRQDSFLCLEEIQPGVSHSCSLLSSTDSWRELAQNFAEVYTQRNQWDLELHRVIEDLETDLSSNPGSSFQLVTHSSWLECLSVKHRPASIRQLVSAQRRNTL